MSNLPRRRRVPLNLSAAQRLTRIVLRGVELLEKAVSLIEEAEKAKVAEPSCPQPLAPPARNGGKNGTGAA
jgi:hypothetical protein